MSLDISQMGRTTKPDAGEVKLTPDEVYRVRQLLLESGWIGAPSLLRRIFRIAALGRTTVFAGSTQEIQIETISTVDEQGLLLHSFYLPPDILPISSTAVFDYFCNGPGITAPGPGHLAGVSGTLIKRRQSGAAGTQLIDVKLVLSNDLGSDLEIAYRVYRIAGLK